MYQPRKRQKKVKIWSSSLSPLAPCVMSAVTRQKALRAAEASIRSLSKTCLVHIISRHFIALDQYIDLSVSYPKFFLKIRQDMTKTGVSTRIMVSSGTMTFNVSNSLELGIRSVTEKDFGQRAECSPRYCRTIHDNLKQTADFDRQAPCSKSSD